MTEDQMRKLLSDKTELIRRLEEKVKVLEKGNEKEALVTFTVHGIPKAQPRVKAFTRGKHAGVYTPAVADDWKTLVALECSRRRPATPATGYVAVDLTFLLPRPKRPKADLPIGKPDVDNLAKAVLDVMTACGWWRDDSQITSLSVRKVYELPEGGWSGVLVDVELMDLPERQHRARGRGALGLRGEEA